ncbi:MAG: amidohydrolase family protein [Betaproteobacteria bacterium]|nr:amidohydrolase family protein [Betaproteobacteria bacterium]
MALILNNGQVIDGRDGPPIAKGWVRVEGRKIVQVGSGESPAPNPGDVVVDAAGGTIMPGMMNLHTHFQRRDLHRAGTGQGVPLRMQGPQREGQPDPIRMAWALKNCWDELREGVTTQRDVGSRNQLNLLVKKVFTEGPFRGPRVVAAGNSISMTGGKGTLEADGPDAVRAAARAQLKAGADWIKVMASGGMGEMPLRGDPRFVEYGLDELRAAVDEAHKRGRRCSAHAYPPEAIKNCVLAGVDCIEHGAILNEETVAVLAKAGTCYVPTMTGACNLMMRERNAGLKWLADLFDTEICQPQRRSIRMAYEAGIVIGTGTDTLGAQVQEMELMHECGLPSLFVIQCATSNAARILGLEKELGTIEAGKLADIIVVEGDPLRDLSTLRRVKTVIRDGHIVTEEWLMGRAGEGVTRR